jgi:hypothetical protein
MFCKTIFFIYNKISEGKDLILIFNKKYLLFYQYSKYIYYAIFVISLYRILFRFNVSKPYRILLG